MKKPSKANFHLDKIKLVSGGGINIDFNVEEVVGSETYHATGNEKSTKEPHPDMANIFRRMETMVAQVYGLTSIKSVVEQPEYKATKKQSEYVDKYIDKTLDRINITGISISGKEDKIGVIITAGIKAGNNQKMAINTHRISLKGTTYGFEEELDEMIATLRNEAYEFVFENKVSNPEMFGPDHFLDNVKPIDGTGDEFDQETDYKKKQANDD